MVLLRSLIFPFLLLICFIDQISSYKILISILTPSKSHYNQAKAVGDILYEHGHEVTIISGYSTKNLPYRSIVVPEIVDANDFDAKFEHAYYSFTQQLESMLDIEYFIKMIIDNAMKSGKLQKFFNESSEKFDLVIMDYLLNESLFGLSVKYDCPLILLSPASMSYFLTRLTGNPSAVATVPDVFLSLSNPMMFKERLQNAISLIFQEFYGVFILDRFHEKAYNEYFPAEAKKMSFQKLRTKISLVLSNTHPTLNVPRPYLPNTVEIGGFHIKKLEPLTKEYQNILDNAKDGVIFFSLGSYIKTHTMPKHIRDIILKSLSKLKQTVLWKFETELEGLPKNVIIKKWMPQPSILAHPNVKLFITHGGILSIIEGTLSGVPLIAIPIFADQHHNVKMIENANTGILTTFSDLTEDKFDTILNEVLNNQTYLENAKKLQKLYNDRPISPQEMVNFYVEYVIRNGGEHFSAPHLNIFSSLLLDVVAVLLIPPILILVIVYCACKKICQSKNKLNRKEKKH